MIDTGKSSRAGSVTLWFCGVPHYALRMLIIGATNWAPEWYRRDGSSSVDELGDLLIRLLRRGVGLGSGRGGNTDG
jgi:Tetracyclin repressor-like, C-terminal domain